MHTGSHTGVILGSGHTGVRVVILTECVWYATLTPIAPTPIAYIMSPRWPYTSSGNSTMRVQPPMWPLTCASGAVPASHDFGARLTPARIQEQSATFAVAITPASPSTHPVSDNPPASPPSFPFQPLVAELPELPILYQPFVRAAQWLAFKLARSSLRVACTGNESGVLQHFEVSRDSRLRHVERFGQTSCYGVLLSSVTSVPF